MEGFGKTEYDRKYTKNGRNVPTQDLLLHLKKIIEEENPSNIPTAPPTNMPKRWKLPQLGKIVVKVEEIDLATDVDNEELMQTSNEMFQMDKESGTTSILHAMQSKVIPCLFDLKDKKTKIEYLFKFDVG